MKRHISPAKVIACILICGVCLIFVIGLLSTQEVVGLVGAGLVICFGFSVTWFVLSLEKDHAPSETQNETEFSQKNYVEAPAQKAPSRDINVRMGFTGLVLFLALFASMAWLAASMYGSLNMLFWGWSWIGFFAAVAIAFVWLVKPKS